MGRGLNLFPPARSCAVPNLVQSCTISTTTLGPASTSPILLQEPLGRCLPTRRTFTTQADATKGDVRARLHKLRQLDAVSYERYLRAVEAVREARNTSCEADLVELMSKVTATTLLEYNQLMHTLTKMRYKPQVQTAGIELLGRMRERGIHPDTVTYTTFINLLKKDRDADKAWLVFRRMREEGLRPNEWTYSTMAHICAQKRNLKSAEELLAMMAEDRVVPNVVVMTGFVDAFLAADKVERAWEMIKTMERRYDVRPNQITLDYILKNSLRESREWDAWAEQQHSKVIASADKAASADESDDHQQPVAMAESNGDNAHVSGPVAKKLERVKLVLRFMRKEYHVVPNAKTFNWLITWCTKNRRNHIELAWGLKKLMKAYRLQPDSVTYVPLLNYYVKQIKALCNADNPEHTLAEENDHGEDAGVLDETSGNEGRHGVDMTGLEELRSAITRTLQEMEDEGVTTDPATTFTLIINAHAACNDAENCFDAYSNFWPALMGPTYSMRRSQVRPTVATYATLLLFCEKHQSVERACALWEDVKKDEINLPWNVICSLLRTALMANKTETVLRVAEELSVSRKPSFVYGELISLCDQRADVRQAERVWQVMRAKQIEVDQPTQKLLADFGFVGLPADVS